MNVAVGPQAAASTAAAPPGAPETWLVLGASSAIARAFARAAAERGADVVLAGRDMEDLARSAADLALRSGRRATTLAFDALDPGAIDALRERSQALPPGRLHAFLAFAVMPDQEATERDPALLRRMVEVNVSATASVLCALAPLLAARGGGRLVVLGSVAGDRGRAKNFLYGATKAAVAAVADGLRARWWREGVSVTLVKPGVVDTAMTWPLAAPAPAAPPEAVARRALRAAERGAATVYAPALWWPIMLVIRFLPTAVFNRLRF
jgi:short-subunit dehydrogenase